MGLFGNSTQEREIKVLMTKAAEIMMNLIDEMEKHQQVTPLVKNYMNQFTIIAGQQMSLADIKLAFAHFMSDFTRQTGEKFPLNY